ncbi:hypothetical protein Mpop_1344 [Methylorubrum populi BJ001]|uniref:Uncharacterized protein n=1 Tax=Methylorubrum populi (strain ATCC BAA-705 / NCIMB 13946 / BJ001) TaxID=441620 RepID=B1ZDH1_METPB|nr:hypothetical protein Mpop_1344 [Methylorubrum populi BJ001]
MSGRLLLGVLYRWVVIFGYVCLRLRLKLRVALNVFFDKGARIFAGHRGIGLGHGLVGSVRWPQSKSPQKAVFRLSSLSAKDARRQAKEQEKRDRLAQQGQAQRKRDEKAAGVDHDPRTAAGQREIQIRGPAVDKRASLADYANLIHRQTDRTPPRLLALERFDTLWHRAHCGLMATPRYERGVDTSRKIAGVPDDRAESLRLIDGVKARIGEEMFAILYHRVINGHSFSWMASQGMGESERLGVLFLAAIDATARHFGLRERSRAVETMEQ